MIHLEPIGPTGRPLSIAASDDARWMALGTDRGEILVYAMPEGRLERVIPSETWVGGLAFGPEGLLWGSNPSRDLCAWEPETGEVVRTFDAREVGGVRLALRRGPRLVLLMGPQVVWVMEGGERVAEVGPYRFVRSYHAQIDDCELHPDGERLLLCFASHTREAPHWVEWRTGEVLGRFAGPAGLRSLRFLGGGERVYMHADEGAWITPWPLREEGPAANEALSAPDHVAIEEEALYWCRDRRVGRAVWGERGEPWDGLHYDNVRRVAVVGEKLVTAAGHRCWLGVRDADSGALERVLPAGAGASVPVMAFDPSGRWLVAISDDGRIQRWDTEAHALHEQLDPTGLGDLDEATRASFGRAPSALGFEPDGAMWAWYGGQLARWPAGGALERPTWRSFEGMPHDVKATTPDGATLLNANWSGEAWIWSPRSGEVAARLEASGQRRRGELGLSPDGALLVSAQDKGAQTELRAWSVDAEPRLRARLQCDHTLCGWVVLSQDQVLLWVQREREGYDAPEPPMTWATWDIDAQTLERWRPGAPGDPTWCSIPPVLDPSGGRLFLTNERLVHVMRLDPPTQERTLEAAEAGDAIATMALHPGGRLLATASRNNMIRLWDLDSGEDVAVYLMTSDGSWLTRTAGGQARRHLSPYARRS